ncbi:MAG TPA: SDR family NAD(P)-dependent oxidoreductase, partial [Polyangiaceae bacterium]|nr:SDR family NAD(P)-dependent oxidoreductase [Polyangiaceae bacterium]
SLRERGVYLITGGLGGIGLVVAEHLARLTKARLVLLGRSPVPPREQWDAWLSSHASNEPTSHRIQKLRAIERLGGEVLTVSADVTDRVQMQGALATARERFGAIHGIVHSAGTIDDNLIAMKTLESAHGVLATKVRGALVLDELLKREPLDFFVLFSSVSSLLGLEGQVDYTAANAFLDAFARRKAASGTRAVAINWNAWQSVGMAMVLADKSRLPVAQSGGATGPHPMLARVLEDSQAESVYSTPFSRAEHWLLSEHVVHGAEALIPGTGYLELARGALEHHPEPGSAVELSNVFFLSPFTVRVGEARELKLRLKRSGPAAGEFSVVSHLDEAPHCTGRVRYVAAPEPGRQDLERLQARCTARIVHVEGFIDQQFVDFGPRWGNVRQIAYGDREALIRLELPSGYDSDLPNFRLHPALLDMATGGAQALVPGFDQSKDFFVPFSYGRLVLLRGLPAKLVSHVRYKQSGAEGLASFDITLYDADGLEVAVISDFVMKRIEQAFAVADEPSAQSARSHMTHLGSVVQHGILPEEGMDALDRILASRLDREIVACSVDLHDWQQRVEAEAEARTRSNENAAGEGGFARPNLSTTYLAPRDDVERELVSMWRELLGVGEVGAHDDFFELGGQSLIAVRLFNKIRRRYSVDLPLSTLFEAPTIARCAEVIREEAGLPELQPDSPGNGEPASDPESVEPAARPPQKRSRWGSLVAIQPNGELPPFFCVAGMGGTLNNLRTLALLMDKERPFFGLQPPGADDPKQRLYRVEDLAAHYLREIRAVQPHGPYFLGGYSGGGVAAFEMSKQLEADGESVAFLAFLDSFSPSLPMRPLTDRALIHLRRMQAQGASYFTDALGRRVDYQKAVMTRRAQRELGRLFPQKYRYQNLGDSWVIAESHYQPTSWQGRATLFRAHEESALSLWTAYIVDEQHGWGRYVTGGVDVVLCAGNHQTMCEEPFVRDLAQKLRSAIDAHTPRPDARDNGIDRSAPVSSSMGPAHAP